MKHIKKDKLKLKFCESLQKMGAKLHLGPATLATVTLEIADENGKIEKRIDMKSNSFVRNYYNWLAYSALYKPSCNATNSGSGTFGDGADTPLKDVSGTIKTFTGPGTTNCIYSLGGESGNMTQGIVVGASDLAESFDSYQLGSKIAHGSGAGQLSYGIQSGAAGHAFDNTTKKLTSTHSRTFSNSSGATITIKEIGWLACKRIDNNTSYFLVIRDVLSTPIDLPVGKTLTVSYNLSLIMSN